MFNRDHVGRKARPTSHWPVVGTTHRFGELAVAIGFSGSICWRVRQRIQISVVLFAWFLATGSQWDLAQLVAWGRMFAGYSQAMDVRAAFQKTFSGEMCPICKAVQNGKQAQDAAGSKTTEAKPLGKALDLCPLAGVAYFLSPARGQVGVLPTAVALIGRDRAEPPSPPPRFAV